MNDLIQRQAALDIFDDYNVAVENGQIEAYSRERKRLCDLPPTQPKQRWIPCSERLPKTDNWRTIYIVTYDRGYKEDAELKTTCMSWENTTVRGKPVSRWIWHNTLSPWKVVAWMPLPKPWEGEENV